MLPLDNMSQEEGEFSKRGKGTKSGKRLLTNWEEGIQVSHTKWDKLCVFFINTLLYCIPKYSKCTRWGLPHFHYLFYPSLRTVL